MGRRLHEFGPARSAWTFQYNQSMTQAAELRPLDLARSIANREAAHARKIIARLQKLRPLDSVRILDIGVPHAPSGVVRSSYATKLIADVVVPGCSYAAIK